MPGRGNILDHLCRTVFNWTQRPVDKVKIAKGEVALRDEARSKHHLMTHVSKNRFCPACQRVKLFKPPSFQPNGSRLIDAENFWRPSYRRLLGFYRDNEEEISESRLAFVMKDVATGFLAAYSRNQRCC